MHYKLLVKCIGPNIILSNKNIALAQIFKTFIARFMNIISENP